MFGSDDQVGYWDMVAWDKVFTHPVNLPLLRRHLSLESSILDYGCGYGRVCQELAACGYSQVIGVDFSSEMIARGRHTHPALRLEVLAGARLPYLDASFDAVLLMAVLTCIPFDDGQRSLIAELRRVLRPGGVLYISDYVLQKDERNLRRYVQYAAEFGVYGIFQIPEGGVFRHHSMDWIRTLLADFDELDVSYPMVTTMNGHVSQAFQYLGRKPG